VILAFTDHDGDPIAVDSERIRGLSVGAIARPHPADQSFTVTLVWVADVPQPFMVAASFAEVLDLWTQAREATAPSSVPGSQVIAYPGVFPLVAHQYPHPSTLLPDRKPAWAAKPPSKEVDGGS
jgi:hypothetical protein